MIPRFANPHRLTDAVQIVSRTALDAPDTELAGYTDAENQMLLANLEQTVRGNLGNLNIPATTVHYLSNDDASKRKRKRRRLESEQDLEVTPLFRLISTALPPKAVCLTPKPLPAAITREPACEDDEAGSAQRARRAHAVAVDLAWITRESAKSHLIPAKDERRLTHFRATLPSPAPALMVAEAPRPNHSLRVSFLSGKTTPSPSPHEVIKKGVACAVLDVVPISAPHESVISGTAARRRARRRKTQERTQRLPPTFWRPVRQHGGKGFGYAMGYEGSWPVSPDAPRVAYRRDTMRKAVPSSCF